MPANISRSEYLKTNPSGLNSKNVYNFPKLPRSISQDGSTSQGWSPYNSGLTQPDGLVNIKIPDGSCFRQGCQHLCLNCKVSPEAMTWIRKNQPEHLNKTLDFSRETLRKLRIINDAGDYVPYDNNWIDQFPELKRITPFSKNYYDATPTRSEKEFQDELNKIRDAEPLQILNEVQHIKPEIIETPIQEKSFIDKNKNYLIIGGVAITAVILILAVRK